MRGNGVLGLHKWGAGGGCISDFSSIANLVPGLRRDYRLFIPVSITDDSSKSSFIDRFLSGQPPVKLFTSILLILLYNPHSPIVNLHLTAEVIRSSEKLHHSLQVPLRSQGALCLPPEVKNSPPSSPPPIPIMVGQCPAPSKTSGFPASIPDTQRPGSSNQGEEGRQRCSSPARSL